MGDLNEPTSVFLVDKPKMTNCVRPESPFADFEHIHNRAHFRRLSSASAHFISASVGCLIGFTLAFRTLGPISDRFTRIRPDISRHLLLLGKMVLWRRGKMWQGHMTMLTMIFYFIFYILRAL